MTLDRSWQFIGPVGSVWYRIYDRLRRGVNRRLTSFLHHSAVGRGHTQFPIRVLEAGSGTAYASSLLARMDEIDCAVCLDIDPEALGEARNLNPQVLAVAADLRHMPFAADTFQLVFNNSTVEHFDDPSAAVVEMHRVCRREGFVFVGVPYVWGPLGFQPIIGRTRIGHWLGRVFTRRRLDQMLSSAGLTPVSHLRFFFRFFIGAIAAKSSGERAPEVAGC